MGLIRGKSGYLKLPNIYHLFARVHWWEDYSVEENYSIVSAEMEIMAEEWDYLGTWYLGGYDREHKGQVLVGGNVIGSMTQFSPADNKATVTKLNEWVVVTKYDGSALSWSSGKINHNGDGTGSTTIATNHLLSYRSEGSVNHSFGTASAQTIALTTIPRASVITSVSDVTLGNNCSVTWMPLAPSFRYKLKFAIGGWSYTTGVIHPMRTTAYTYTGYTFPIEVANQVLTRAGNMTATLYSYSDSGATAQIGSASSKTFTVTVPENYATRPTVSMSLSPVSTLDAPFNSLYIQGHSKVKATLTPSTKYGASVAASNITVGGVTYDSPYESAILTQAGKQSVKGLVKDSRGYYGTIYKEIDVIPYSKPYVRSKSGETDIIAARCDASSNFSDSGTYLKIKAKVVYEKVISNGTQNNFAKIQFRYRKEGGAYSAWQTILDSKTQNSDEVITAPLLNGGLDVKSNYQVQIMASDELYTSAPVTIAVPSDSAYMDRPAGGKSMAIGGYSTGAGIFDVYWRTKARGGLSVFDAMGNEIPLDSTMPIPRNQVPEGWNPDALDCGVHVVANNRALKQGDSVIMYNGVLIQMNGDVAGNVKLQLALPTDTNRSPMYRICWYSNWSDWRSLKL